MYTYIKAEREKRGMEQKELAAKIGVAVPTLGNYEAGRREPPLDVLCAVADLFDISLDLLIRGKEKDHSEEWSREFLISQIKDADMDTLRQMMALSAYWQDKRWREAPPGEV